MASRDDGGDPACWGGGYDRHLCCDCGFPLCWSPPLFTARRCCPPGSRAVAERRAPPPPSRNESSRGGLPLHALARGNATAMAGRRLLCRPEEVQRCATLPGALRDRDCLEMARFVAGSTYECKQRLAGFEPCERGFAFAIWNAWRYPRAVMDKRTREDTHWCSLALRTFRLAHRRLSLLPEEARQGPGRRWFERRYRRHLRRCSAIRGRELRRHLPAAEAAFAPAERGGAARPWVGGRPRIGVILAVAPKDADFYSRTLDLWRCYCRRHEDCEVVIETADFLKEGQYPYTMSIDPHTAEIRPRVGKAWNRWFALRRHLEAYEWVFTADPDQFPSRECFGSVALSAALPAAGGISQASPPPLPTVVMRDFPRFHTLNSAGVFFRGGAAARLFLDLLFGRAYWEGFADFDQSAFDHTVLEFMDLWASATQTAATRRHHRRLESPKCLVEQFADIESRNVLEPFVNCWHDFMDRLVGPFGARRLGDSPVRLVDPRGLDINFVLGPRRRDDAPLVWHMAGQDKFYREAPEKGNYSVMDRFMLQDWGFAELPPAAGLGVEGLNCTPWEQGWLAAPRTCDPGTEVYDCRTPWLAIC